MSRVYLDWNATAPVRPEARAAMLDAMELLGNPSSVHAEGRAARAIVENARVDIATTLGANSADIVFTGSATEAAALALSGRDLVSSATEHPCVSSWTRADLTCDHNGRILVEDPSVSAMQCANSETGVLQTMPKQLAFADCVQGFGKIPLAFDWAETDMAIVSAHKLGGPKGVGALVLRKGLDIKAQIRGGGQEMGRRAGTENIIGIAGFAAAAKAAARDLDAGLWDKVRDARDALEDRLQDGADDIRIFGKDTERLPNTSYFGVPGWKGETQVMQMDMAGFAVSAGSACSSGKIRPSQVLTAMGLDAVTASSAIRVSIGPLTTPDELTRFADTWLAAKRRFQARAA